MPSDVGPRFSTIDGLCDRSAGGANPASCIVSPLSEQKDDDSLMRGRQRYSTSLLLLAALQVADAFLTVRGLEAGVHEQNPLMRGSRGVMAITKVLTTASTIVIAEKMWKRNRIAAIATMVAANAVTAVVVGRNARIVSAARR